MSRYRYGGSSSSKVSPVPTGMSEFEILKAKHQFLRDEDEGQEASAASSTWDDQLAKKYYDSLYREFAICDLKHFKSGNFSLRWRTEDEVLSGTGETTCANSRCAYHHENGSWARGTPPKLATLELPFAYEEHGVQKSALVKVVLCPGCVRKLMWKRMKEKEKAEEERGKMKEEEEEDGGERRKRARDRKEDEEKEEKERRDSRRRRERSEKRESRRRDEDDGRRTSRRVEFEDEGHHRAGPRDADTPQRERDRSRSRSPLRIKGASSRRRSPRPSSSTPHS